MNTTEDRYGGITIDQNSIPTTTVQFRRELLNIIEREVDKKLLWITIPASNAQMIPVLTEQDFDFHHCNEKDVTLVKKLVANPVVPTAKSHTVGVGAIVIEGSDILVIRDRFSQGYKLPGGHIDPNEGVVDALKREVLEETGVSVEFESIVNFSHFTEAQFGESNIYMVCSAKAITRDINIIDCSEIIEAKWMNVDEYLQRSDTNPFNRKIVETHRSNGELKLTKQDVLLKMKTPYELFF